MKKFLFIIILIFAFSLLGFAQQYYYSGNNPYKRFKNNKSSTGTSAEYVVPSETHLVKTKFFGFGTVPVIDVKAIAQAIKTYKKLKDTYEKIKARYDLALKMSRYIQNMPERYRVLFAKFRKIKDPDDFFNKIDGLISVYNGEIKDTEGVMNEVSNVYSNMTEKVKKEDFSYVENMSDKQANVYKDFAKRINILDNTNKIALSTITQANSIQEELEKKINNLDADSLSSSEELNSEIAVLNKINAALMILIKQQKQMSSLLITMLQQQLSSNIVKRDAIVQGQVLENEKIKSSEEEIKKYNKFFSIKQGE